MNKENDSHEEWRDIKESSNKYSVSNQGRVRNNITGNVLKPVDYGKGYTKVNLRYGGKEHNRQVHRLVAIAFIPNPENKPQVNHKNGVHDDNRLENLEWVTQEENLKHAYDTGLVRHKDDRYSGYLYGVWKKQHKDNCCDEWQDFLRFYSWCYENGYSEGLFVCRYDCESEFSPQNCYIGCDCQRPNKKYEIFNERLTHKEIEEKYNISEQCLSYRLKKGMSMEEAITYTKKKPKENSLRIRLNDQMYNHLIQESEDRHCSISAYIRELIDKDISESRNSEKILK